MATTRITCKDNGSLRVEGEFELVDGRGNVIAMPGIEQVSLCRCGHSANKPFCDGAHRTSGFDSAITVASTNPPRPKPAG